MKLRPKANYWAIKSTLANRKPWCRPPPNTQLSLTLAIPIFNIFKCADNPQPGKKLYSTNLNQFMKSLNEALGAWSHFTLSFLGMANRLKMIMFPELLYLFQSLPMYLCPETKKRINKLFRTFTWQGKRPRIAYNILQQHKGGVNLPDIKLYNLSTNLCVLQDWISGSSKFSPLTLEAQIYPSTTLVNLLHSPFSLVYPSR